MEINRNTIAIIAITMAILAISTIAMMKDANAIIQHRNGQNANGVRGTDANGLPGQNGGIGTAGGAGGVAESGGNNCIGSC